jgi:uncharacterized protein
MRLVVITALWLAAWPALSNAASFDCTKSRSFVENTICADKELSELDSQLADVYRPAADTRLKSDQRNWLQYVRNTCQTAACIKSVYKHRLKQLASYAPGGASHGQLTMTCEYHVDDSSTLQQVTLIPEETYSIGENIHQFTSASLPVKLHIAPEKYAECLYPGNFQVRVKIGYDDKANPQGYCGAESPIILAFWVNQRKIASRSWFAGHCIEESAEPEITSITISRFNNQIRIKKCQKARTPDTDTSQNTQDVPIDQPKQTCIDYPDQNSLPRDITEYPLHPQNAPLAGGYTILRGKDQPVCRAFVGDQVLQSFQPEFRSQDLLKLDYQKWVDRSREPLNNSGPKPA